MVLWLTECMRIKCVPCVHIRQCVYATTPLKRGAISCQNVWWWKKLTSASEFCDIYLIPGQRTTIQYIRLYITYYKAHTYIRWAIYYILHNTYVHTGHSNWYAVDSHLAMHQGIHRVKALPKHISGVIQTIGHIRSPSHPVCLVEWPSPRLSQGQRRDCI